MPSTFRLASAALFAAALISTTACAASRPYFPGPGARPADRRAYDYGFVEGRQRGAEDAERRRPFDYERHRVFRNADAGYRGYGDRGAYRLLFREGFAAGYTEGYRRFGGYTTRGPRFPSSTRYASAASENGFRDGFEQGQKDRRDRKRFDPVRAERYRSGDNDYERRYGSRDAYKREYRAAFLQGYDAGYRS